MLLAGCLLVIFYVGKKLTFAVAIHLNPKISFFFEGACALTNTAGVNNLAGPKTDEDTVEVNVVLLCEVVTHVSLLKLNMYTPLYDENTLLY